MYKLFCVDMDGTLLDDNKRLSNKNAEAIRWAYKKGLTTVICTGRLFSFANTFVDRLGIKAPVICANGAYIRYGDKIVYKAELGEENCRLVLDVLKKNNMYPHYNTSDTVLTEKIIFSSQAYAKMNESLPEGKKFKIQVVEDWDNALHTYSDEILKCITADNDIDKVRRVKKQLRENGSLEVVSSSVNNMEIMRKGVSKGRAVEILASCMGIKREEIICAGDSENDISMLEFAGLGVAMGNGEERVKAAADFITAGNNEDGIAKVIETFV